MLTICTFDGVQSSKLLDSFNTDKPELHKLVYPTFVNIPISSFNIVKAQFKDHFVAINIIDLFPHQFNYNDNSICIDISSSDRPYYSINNRLAIDCVVAALLAINKINVLKYNHISPQSISHIAYMRFMLFSTFCCSSSLINKTEILNNFISLRKHFYSNNGFGFLDKEESDLWFTLSYVPMFLNNIIPLDVIIVLSVNYNITSSNNKKLSILM